MTVSKISGLIFFLLVGAKISAQTTVINLLDSGTKTSIRGLSVVSDKVIWASGSNGSVARSTDGGKTFQWMQVTGYEKRDFRDIEAFDKSTAIIMAVADPGIILKTKDGGQTWYKVFEDTAKGMFLDAMHFYKKTGIVVGDPIHGKIYLRYTDDAGESWTEKLAAAPFVTEGEACFASSGSNILLRKDGGYLLVTGGIKSNLYADNSTLPLDIIQGRESTGANSIATYKNKYFTIVGGDFTNDKNPTGNCLFTADLKNGFHKPATPPHGYRSCVIYISKEMMLCCGTSGIDISRDSGNNWEVISGKSFHVCAKAKKGKKIFLAGGNGKIAEFVYN